MRRGSNRCGYVIREAGKSVTGQPVAVGYGGDKTQVCGKSGNSVPHTFHTRKPGTTAVYESFEGTVIRCQEHADHA